MSKAARPRTADSPTAEPSTPNSAVADSVAAQPSARRVQTRQRLMRAAVDVFAERGVLGASVEEICEAAGFTRGAFYSNFADKNALVLALIEANIVDSTAAARRAIDGLAELPAQTNTGELLSYVLTRFQATGRSDRTSALIEQELLLYAARVPELREPYRQFAESSRSEMRQLIADAVALRRLEFTVDLDTAQQLLLATHEHMQLDALFTGRADSSLMHALILAMTRPQP